MICSVYLRFVIVSWQHLVRHVLNMLLKLYYGLWHARPNIEINKVIKEEKVDHPWLWEKI